MRFETEIRDTAYGGYGIGVFSDGRAAFIPFTVEGDVVIAELTEDKKDFIYAELKEIKTPSALRGEKYCPHIGSCGGCSFGHIDYQAQKDIKLKIVKQAFRKQKVSISDNILSSSPLRYRNRVTFKVVNGELGFYSFKSRNFIAVNDCPLVSEELVNRCKDFVKANDQNISYELYAIENTKGEFLAKVKGIEANDIKFSAFDGVSGVDFILGYETTEYPTPNGNILVSGDSFFQSNKFMLDDLQKRATGISGVNALELYSGSGFFTVGLAKNFRSITAVEVSQDAVRLAKKLGISNLRCVASDVAKFLKTAKGRFDNLFVDPPRAGLDKNVCNYIKNNPFAVVTYVSCNPTTLARDIKRIEDIYQVSELTVLDMYPNTHHVECIAKLVLKKSK